MEQKTDNQELKDLEEKLRLLDKQIWKYELCRESHNVSSRQRKVEYERNECMKRIQELLDQRVIE